MLAFFSQLPRCVVAMEACGGAHFWSREIGKLGHKVRLVPAAYVKPFVKRQKNDMADAEATCEAGTQAILRRHLGEFGKIVSSKGVMKKKLNPRLARGDICGLFVPVRRIVEADSRYAGPGIPVSAVRAFCSPRFGFPTFETHQLPPRRVGATMAVNMLSKYSN